MSIFASPMFLRRVLQLDALSCAATGGLQVALAAPLAGLLGWPRGLLLGTGLFLLVYAAAVGLLAARRELPSAWVWAVVAANLLWALDCVWLVASGRFGPTPLGQVWVLAQVVVVVVLAELQWMGLRARRAAPAH